MFHDCDMFITEVDPFDPTVGSVTHFPMGCLSIDVCCVMSTVEVMTLMFNDSVECVLVVSIIGDVLGGTPSSD